MTRLRFAAILFAAAARAYYLWPVGNPDTLPGIEIRATPPPTEPSPVTPPAAATEIPATRPPATSDETAASPAPAAQVRLSVPGLVRNASGIPLEGVEIIATNHTANGIELARSSAISDFRGEFVLERLLPARLYSLSVTPRDDHVAYNLQTFIAGQTERLQDIIMRHVSLVDVDGMVVDVDQAPVANFEFVVGSLSTELPVQTVKSDSSGFFSLRGFPAGDIRIATNASEYFSIQGLKLRPDEYRNLTLVIDRGNYHLAGWVSDQNGAPVIEAQVILKSSFDIGDYQSISNRATITGPSGGFEFAQLGGKPVTLAIYANGFETRTLQHRFGSYSDILNVELVPVARSGAAEQ